MGGCWQEGWGWDYVAGGREGGIERTLVGGAGGRVTWKLEGMLLCGCKINMCQTASTLNIKFLVMIGVNIHTCVVFTVNNKCVRICS